MINAANTTFLLYAHCLRILQSSRYFTAVIAVVKMLSVSLLFALLLSCGFYLSVVFLLFVAPSVILDFRPFTSSTPSLGCFLLDCFPVDTIYPLPFAFGPQSQKKCFGVCQPCLPTAEGGDTLVRTEWIACSRTMGKRQLSPACLA